MKDRKRLSSWLLISALAYMAIAVTRPPGVTIVSFVQIAVGLVFLALLAALVVSLLRRRVTRPRR
jgi:hypothetical protein